MNKTEPEAWTYGIDWQSSERWGWRTGGKKVKTLAKEQVCIAHGHRQWCDGSQGRGDRGWVEVGKRGENRWGQKGRKPGEFSPRQFYMILCEAVLYFFINITGVEAASSTLQNGLSAHANSRDTEKQVRGLLIFAECFLGNRFIPQGINLKSTCSILNILIFLH